ncbi:hypothetical protein HYPSUDRAFT_422739 [Hypholoma sublateritium FD-334 SS-4]|uniref:Uncharacterized protein n=1 Tax=Hypholoma sublateritium (strain FD-334 SS-4) TaxID=945553 RepID=A0A0D2P326_HYPSF|nr:hypothetical protein HYPSUDRAFT_422739 [Hypholoma sublateritium FD-334 SS-4]
MGRSGPLYIYFSHTDCATSLFSCLYFFCASPIMVFLPYQKTAFSASSRSSFLCLCDVSGIFRRIPHMSILFLGSHPRQVSDKACVCTYNISVCYFCNFWHYEEH